MNNNRLTDCSCSNIQFILSPRNRQLGRLPQLLEELQLHWEFIAASLQCLCYTEPRDIEATWVISGDREQSHMS